MGASANKTGGPTGRVRGGGPSIAAVEEMSSAPKPRKHDRRPEETTSEWIDRITTC